MVLFGVGDGSLDGFVERLGSRFLDEFEIVEGGFGGEGAHRIGDEAELPGTGSDVFLCCFHIYFVTRNTFTRLHGFLCLA